MAMVVITDWVPGFRLDADIARQGPTS